MAEELGFSCIQLPSKVLYASMGIDRGGLTRELADHLRAVLDEAGVSVAVLGCYKNLATPDRQQLMDNYAEYEARWVPRPVAPMRRTASRTTA